MVLLPSISLMSLFPFTAEEFLRDARVFDRAMVEACLERPEIPLPDGVL